MRTWQTTLWAGAVILAAAGCDQNRAGGTDNTPSSPAEPELQQPAGGAPVTNTGASIDVDPLATVENRNQVREHPDEVTIIPGRETKLITGFSAAVRTSPSGEAFSTVEVAENATEIARDRQGDYYLVIYPDPRDASKKLAGWVYKDALENTGWATSGTMAPMASKLRCNSGASHLRADRDFCGKTCKDDGSCDKKNGEICDGLAFAVHEGTSKLTNIRYCVSGATSGNGSRGANAK